MKKTEKVTIILLLLTLSITSLTLGVYWYKVNVVQQQAEVDANKWFQFDLSVFEDYGIDVLPLKVKLTHVPFVLVYSNVLFFGEIAHEIKIKKVYYRFEGTSYFFWFMHAGIGYQYRQQFGW